MMLSLTNKDGVSGGEGTRLLSSASASASSHHDSVSFAIFSDLTYSDDEENEDMWDAEYSSPDTAALMEEILSNTVIHEERQAHLMHPLALHQLDQRGTEADEGSTLAYSITSSTAVGDDDEGGSRGSMSTTPTGGYGALDSLASSPSFGFVKPKGAVGIFRPPSPVVEHSPRPPQAQYAQQYPYQQREQQQRRRSSSPITSTLKPKRSREFLVQQPPLAGKTYAGGMGRHRSPSPDNSNNIKSIFQHQHAHFVTPLPFRTDDSSPATSATAADTPEEVASSCAVVAGGGRTPSDRRGGRAPGGTVPTEDEERRMRRNRRLGRIRRAAEAREAAVREVRGTDQRGDGGRRRMCRDVPFAFAFLCQFLLVSMSALAFAPGALRDKVYGPLEPSAGSTMAGEGGARGDSKKAGSMGDRNPFAGLQTDDIIILDGGTAVKKSKRAHGWDQAFDDSDGIISRIDYVNVIQLVCIASGWACLCSLLALGFMMMLSKNCIHSTLIFTIAVSLIWTILGLAYGSRYLIISVSGVVSLALSLLYTVVVWDRISFAATNLSVALKCMRETLVIVFMGLCVLAVTFLWTLWWMCAFIGTFNFLNDDEGLSNDWISVAVTFYFLSYYWTFQVIKGVSKATVANIIGEWWDVSEDDAFPVCHSIRPKIIALNIVDSFGSICLASLIVDPCVLITRIATFTRLARWKHSGAKCSESPDKSPPPNESISPHSDNELSRRVNRWSYAYIGLYGYKFWESGRKASQLFDARGWTQFVSDDLIMTVMGMSSIIIGGSTAFMGLIVEEVDGYYFTSVHKPIEAAFLVCLFVGCFLSSAFLSIVEGCVNAILVCYAAAPITFHANHHKLSEEMKVVVWKYFWLQKPQ